MSDNPNQTPKAPLNEAALPFSRAEYAERLAKVRRQMQQRDMELLIISDPSNMAWLSGYDGWSFYVHQCVIVTADGEPYWYGRQQDGNGARRTVYMSPANILTYADHYVQSMERHPMDHLAALIVEHGWQHRRIGVEMDNYYFSAAALRALQRHLSASEFVDATGLVNWQRCIKSATELEYMRRAGRIVEVMHERIRQQLVPGMRKCDLVAQIYAAGIGGVAGYGGDYPAIVPLLPSGDAAAAPHLTWDDAPMRSGEGTFFEIAGCYRRYHCPLSRTAFLGRPTATFVNAEKAVLEGLERGLEQARAGNVAEDIAAAYFQVLQRYGIEKNDRAGYSIGLSYPPDWGERTISLRAGDKSELKVNMTLHFMTGLWMEGWGFEITESIVIGEHGAECLANVPRELFVVD